ncbi:MAG: glycosyltransferase family 2 protein [Phycisphaeraceae bacterium]
MTESDSISVLIPAYRSAESLSALVSRLTDVLTPLKREFEIVIVDDCSPDDTWKVLKQLKAEHGPRLKIARLLRNSGQHNAILCGFTLCHGAVIVTMDDDLQNPPEEVPRLIAAVDQGFDLAIGAYEAKQHAGWRNQSGGMIDRLQRRIFKLPRDFQLTSFRAVRRIVVENVCAMGGAFPYITAMLLSHTSNCTNVPVRHEPRTLGKSNYNLPRSLKLAANLILNYSSYPVYAVALASTFAFFFAVVYACAIFYQTLAQGTSVPGWASTMIMISFFNAITMFCLMIFGLYLSRLVRQVSRTRVSFTIGELHE